MDCPNCGAPMHIAHGTDSWNCNYCRSVYNSERNDEIVSIVKETSEFQCPVCSVPLAEAAIDQHKLFYCTRCRGSLIPVQAFGLLMEELRSRQGGAWHISRPADREELRRQIECPRCHRRMDTHFYGGPGNVVIDDCAACDLNWLDKGELARIVSAPESFA